jgi:hypothetical protein
LICSRAYAIVAWMTDPDEELTLADPDDLASALAFA